MRKPYIVPALCIVMSISLSACSNRGNDLVPPSASVAREESQPPSSEEDSEPDMEINAAIAEYRKIKPEQAKDMLDSGDPIILLDVRTIEEFDGLHIDGAVVIPDNEIAQRAPAELDDKNATILIYCRSGRRSALAAKALVDMGYTSVYDFGGIQDWPYETVSDR